MKRILCLALCALMAVFVCACGDDSTNVTEAQTEADVTAAASADSVTPTESSTNAGLKNFINNFDTTPTVEEQQIYDKSDLSVTLHSIDYSATIGPQLKLTIENKSHKDIIVQAPYSVVNGYMISPELNVTVASGKSAGGELSLPYFNLAIANITSLKQIQFALKILDKESYNPIATSDLISVSTSADKGEEDKCDESGQIAYDKDGVKIILKGVNTDRAYSDGAELIVYMCNDTDENIAIQTKTVTVNGYDMTSSMNRSILSGKKAVDVVTFYALDMEEYDIESIDSVSVSFVIKNADTRDNIDSTDVINVELKQKETAAPTEKSTEAAE